jgi:hypothetical protein
MTMKPRDQTPEELRNIKPTGDKTGEQAEAQPRKQRVGENPPNPDADGMPIGNGATGKPAAFPPHN